MSRIGKLPINIPGGVTITVGDDNTVVVKGPKGELSEKISPKMHVSMDNGVLHVTRPDDMKENRALHGLSRSLINNMVVGVTHGYSKSLEILFLLPPSVRALLPNLLKMPHSTAFLSTEEKYRKTPNMQISLNMQSSLLYRRQVL